MSQQEHWKQTAFDLLQERSDCLIIYLAADGSIKAFNRKAEDIYNWRLRDILNKNFILLCRQFDYQVPVENLAPILAGATYKDIIITLKTINDKKMFLKWTLSPLLDKEAGEKGVLLMGMDITPYQQAEEELRKTVLYLDNIINHIPHYIFWKDVNSVFLGCNRKFADAAGLVSPHDIVNKTDYDLPWSKEQSLAYIKDDKEIMATGKPKLNYEETQRQLDGKERVQLVSKVPIIDKKTGQVTGLLGIYADITERKQMENHLRQAKEKAELANLAKMEFIRNMEHDIRTPFHGIWGISNMLWEQETDPAKKDYLNDIARAAKELLDFCNDILDYTKTELNILPVFSKKFEIKNLVDNVIAIEKPAAKFKNLDLSLEYDEKIPPVLIGDHYRLQRILINLLSNAIKFTEKGFIKLRVNFINQNGPKSIILRFYVEDSGIGIPLDKTQFIFEKFSRLNPANKNQYKGIGLGLSVVKQFMYELQGEVDIKSVPGQGSAFICTLPFELPLVNEIVN